MPQTSDDRVTACLFDLGQAIQSDAFRADLVAALEAAANEGVEEDIERQASETLAAVSAMQGVATREQLSEMLERRIRRFVASCAVAWVRARLMRRADGERPAP